MDYVATYNFFHQKYWFIYYNKIDPEIVHAAYGKNILIGRGKVLIPVADWTIEEAYQAPGFSAHIVAAHLIYEHLDVVLYLTIKESNGCYMLYGSLPERVICFFHEPSLMRPHAIISKKDESYQEWNDKAGNISSGKYQDLFRIRTDVTNFYTMIKSDTTRIRTVSDGVDV